MKICDSPNLGKVSEKYRKQTEHRPTCLVIGSNGNKIEFVTIVNGRRAVLHTWTPEQFKEELTNV